MTRARAAPGPRREKRLDHPVLERMERDHDEAAARLEDALGGHETARELAELVIDVETQRLERARRRMDVPRPRAHHAPHDLGQRGCGPDRRLRTRLHNGASDRPRAPLLAE